MFLIQFTGKIIAVLFTLFLIAVLAAPFAKAEPIVVVTQKGAPITTLTREEIADLFLGKRKIKVSDQTLTPIDLDDESLRESFYQQVAEMSAMRVNAYWARLVFSAQGRPPQKLPLSEAKELVRSQPGWVTYVPTKDKSSFNILLNLP